MGYKQRVAVKGRLLGRIVTPDPDAIVLKGVEFRGIRKNEAGLWEIDFERDNAFLNQGLQAILRRWANIAAVPAAPTGIGVSSSTSAVTAASTQFGGTFRYSAFDATFPSITGQTASFRSSFSKGSGAGQIDFAVTKIGITNANADTAGAVQDIIGGSGGSAPYNEPISLDMSSATSFVFSPQIDVTLTAV